MKFAELDRKTQERLLQEEAEALDYEWWDCTEEDYKEQGKERGFDIEKMFWSGFSSQGDGASWVGTVDIKRFLAFHLKPENPQFAQYVVLQELAANGWTDTYAKITANGRYSHEYTMRCGEIAVSGYGTEDTLENGPLAGASVEVLVEDVISEQVLEALEEWILEQAQDYARKYYASLEDEYEYLTSEEALAERGLDYDEDGNELADAGESVSPQIELEI